MVPNGQYDDDAKMTIFFTNGAKWPIPRRCQNDHFFLVYELKLAKNGAKWATRVTVTRHGHAVTRGLWGVRACSRGEGGVPGPWTLQHIYQNSNLILF